MRAVLACLTVVLATVALTVSPAAAADEYRPASFPEMAAVTAHRVLTGQDPAAPPPGVNRWDCEPSAAHPNPVVLVHGLNGNLYNGWANIGPRLANAGYCVFGLNYGGTNAWDGGTRPVRQSATEIAAFVDKVLAETGAAEVDLVGHSEGGFHVLYVPKVVDGMAGKVGTVFAMAPPTHGTDLHGAVTVIDLLGLRHLVGRFCAACDDILPGGDGVTELTDGPIAQPGIRYTTLISKHDGAITPYTSAAVGEPGVTDIVLQDRCPQDVSGHSGIAFNQTVTQLIRNALDPAHPVTVTCTGGPPF